MLIHWRRGTVRVDAGLRRPVHVLQLHGPIGPDIPWVCLLDQGASDSSLVFEQDVLVSKLALLLVQLTPLQEIELVLAGAAHELESGQAFWSNVPIHVVRLTVLDMLVEDLFLWPHVRRALLELLPRGRERIFVDGDLG